MKVAIFTPNVYSNVYKRLVVFSPVAQMDRALVS
jgi:hypothetical protein